MEKSPKVFIIYAHENPMSLCGNLKDRTIKLLQENNIYFKLSDLYAQKFNPIISWEDYVNMNAAKEIPFNLENYQKIGSDLNAFSKDISAELDKFLEADFLIFIAPMFWSSFPAIMKGWIERVFVRGKVWDFDAFYETGLWKSKKALLVMTTGTAECEFKEDGLIKMSFDQIMSGFTRCTLGFCGIGVIPSFVFYAPNLMKKEDLENKLKEYDDYIKEKIILGEN